MSPWGDPVPATVIGSFDARRESFWHGRYDEQHRTVHALEDEIVRLRKDLAVAREALEYIVGPWWEAKLPPCLIVLVNDDDSFTPVCDICHYVGCQQSARSGANAALTNHRTGVSHRRALRNMQTPARSGANAALTAGTQRNGRW